MTDGKYDVRKFDPRTVRPRDSTSKGKVIGIVGGRGSGKSLLTKDIMYHLRDIPMGIVMSGTEDGNGFYSKFVPELFVYSEFRKDVLEKLLETQQTQAKKGNARKVFIVLDDLMYDSKNIMKEKVVRQLFMNGRHWGITIINVAQSALDLGPPNMRDQYDFVMAFREASFQGREKLYKLYFGIVPTMKDFNALMMACTENYECIVVSKEAVRTAHKVDDMIFWYKAEVHPPFKMGHRLFWKYHHKRYKGRAETSLEEIKAGGIRKLK